MMVPHNQYIWFPLELLCLHSFFVSNARLLVVAMIQDCLSFNFFKIQYYDDWYTAKAENTSTLFNLLKKIHSASNHWWELDILVSTMPKYEGLQSPHHSHVQLTCTEKMVCFSSNVLSLVFVWNNFTALTTRDKLICSINSRHSLKLLENVPVSLIVNPMYRSDHPFWLTSLSFC